MLRGPQTPGELRQRVDRLYSFPDQAAFQATLDRLIERGFIARHAAPPGPEGGALRAPAERGPRGRRRPPRTPAPAPFQPAARAAPAPRSDVARIDELERQVAALTAQVAELRAAAGLGD